MAQLDLLVRAFIPGNIPGLTFTIPNGPLAGKSALHGPGSLIPGNLHHDDFLTDQRSFSSDLAASCRMETFVSIDTATATIIRKSNRADFSHSTDHTTGSITCRRQASMTRTRVDASNWVPAQPLGNPLMKVKLHFIGQENNPCFAGSPDVDWDLTFTIEARADGTRGEIKVEGVVDPFPAFECYARLGPTTPMRLLFLMQPLTGATPWNLIGLANQRVSANIVV